MFAKRNRDVLELKKLEAAGVLFVENDDGDKREPGDASEPSQSRKWDYPEISRKISRNHSEAGRVVAGQGGRERAVEMQPLKE